MPLYGEVGYTIVDLRIAALLSTGLYGTSVQLDYLQELEFTTQADTDMIKAFGYQVESLSVPTHATGTMQLGSIDFSAYVILAGLTEVISGTAPTEQSILDILAGGESGLPYFGVVGKLQSVLGADLHVGFFKAKLDTVPGFRMEQNRFILPQSAMTMIVNNQTDRKLVRLERHETAIVIESDFDVFFA